MSCSNDIKHRALESGDLGASLKMWYSFIRHLDVAVSWFETSQMYNFLTVFISSCTCVGLRTFSVEIENRKKYLTQKKLLPHWKYLFESSDTMLVHSKLPQEN